MAAHRRRANVKQHFHHDTFIERLVELQQAAVRRKRTEARAYLPSILQLKQGQHRSTKFHARTALLALQLWRLGHATSTIASPLPP
jgi:hypothetical protein